MTTKDKLKKFTWTTVFDTTNGLMIHAFSDRIKVITNLQNCDIKVFRDDEVVKEVNNPSVPAYEEFLLQVAKNAEELGQFGPKSADGWFATCEKWPDEGRPVNGRYDAYPYEVKTLWRKGHDFYSHFECDVEFRVNTPDSWKYVYDENF
jgi:hypothetical protein